MTDNYRESSEKLAFFIDDRGFLAFRLFMFNEGKKFEPLKLKEELLTIPVDFVVTRNHFSFELIQEVAKLTIPFGIPQWLNKNNLHFLYGSIFDNREFGPSVLTVEDLDFGFFIWLAACGISSLTFIVEIFTLLYRLLRRKIGEVLAIIWILKNIPRNG